MARRDTWVGRATTGAVVGTALALSGCGAGAGPDAEATDQPGEGGAFSFAVLSDPGCADPQQVTSLDAGYWARQVVDSLTDQDPETGEIVPWLATSWEISEDATAFTFTLRDDVTFSDGTPLDAEVVKENFDTLVGLGARASTGIGYLAGYTGSEVVDEHTVVVTFDAPNAQFLQATSTFQLGLVGPASLELSADERCAGVVGAGPFVLTGYVPNESFSLERRDGYAWGSEVVTNTGEAYLDTVTFQVVSESSVRTGGLTSGQLDAVAGVTVQDVAAVESADGSLVVATNPGIGFQLAARSDAPVASDPAVREALSLAIDRDEIVETNYVDGTKPATSILSTATPGYTDLSDLLRHDPEAAVEVLDDAGWEAGPDGTRQKDGTPLTLRLVWTNGAVGNSALVELVQQYASAVGIGIELVEQDQAGFVESLGSGDFDLILTTVTRADPDILRTNFSSTGANQFHVPASDLDGILAAQAAAAVPAERTDLVEQAQREIVERYLAVPLAELTTVVGVADTVEGLALDASSRPRFVDVRKAGS